jgi:hypothetical protein
MSTKKEKAAETAAASEAEKRRKAKKWVLSGAAVIGGFLAVNILAPIVVNHPFWSNVSSDIAVAASWPTLESCDPITAVAGTDDVKRPEADSTSVDRDAVAGRPGGGAWVEGNLTVTILASGDRQTVVRGIKPRIVPVKQSPAWVYAPEGGCGDVATGEFELNLDAGTLTSVDVGQAEGDGSASIPEGAGGFAIDAGTSAQILVSAQACEGSYDFWLDIAYARPNSADVSHKEIGPFRVYSGVTVQANPAVSWLGGSGELARDTPVCAVPTPSS